MDTGKHGGRRFKQIDLAVVEQAAALGLTIKEIAELINVHPTTVLPRAKGALLRGAAKMVLPRCNGG